MTRTKNKTRSKDPIANSQPGNQTFKASNSSVPLWSDLNDGVSSVIETAESAKDDLISVAESCYVAFQDEDDDGDQKAKEEFSRAYSKVTEDDDEDNTSFSSLNPRPTYGPQCNEHNERTGNDEYLKHDNTSIQEPNYIRAHELLSSGRTSPSKNISKGFFKNQKRSCNSLKESGRSERQSKGRYYENDENYSIESSSSSSSDDEVDRVREFRQIDRLGGLLSEEWHATYASASTSPQLTKRLINFKFAQERRKEIYGSGSNGDATSDTPFGIFGVYEQLADIRTDIKWAEEVERRKETGEQHVTWEEFDEQNDASWYTPRITFPIMLICTFVLILSFILNGWRFEPLSVNPVIGPSSDVLISLGAKSTDLIVNNFEIHRLITPMFLHGGIIHYGVNMLALYAVGTALEQAHGAAVTATFFVISGVGGNILSALFAPKYISVGASGAIFGLIGACMGDIVMHWSLLFGRTVNGRVSWTRYLCVLLMLFLELGINFLIGLTPAIDNFTHMGGMVYGFLLAFIMIRKDIFSMKARSSSIFVRSNVVSNFCLFILLTSLLASLFALFMGDGLNPPCEACQAISCVEFPPWAGITNKWWYCDSCDFTGADVRTDEENGKYDLIVIYCPDGTLAKIDIDYYYTNEASTTISENLPSYCRLYC